MDTIRKLGKSVGVLVGTVTGEPIKCIGKRLDSGYIQEIGETVKVSSYNTGETVGQFVNGVVSTTIGAATKDPSLKSSGLNDVGASITQTSKGLYDGLKKTGEDIKDVIQGTVEGNKEQVINGAKGIGKVVAVGTLTIGIFDLIDGVDPIEHADTISKIDQDKISNHMKLSYSGEDYLNPPNEVADTNEFEIVNISDADYQLDTRNEDLAGTEHPETQVPFVEKTITLSDGQNYVGVFPDFQEAYSVQIPSYLYLDTDDMHFSYANHQLAFEIANDQEMASHFSPIQLEQIQQGEPPDGYVWHHSEEPGRLELVNRSVHEQTAHTGGRELWGGGSHNR